LFNRAELLIYSYITTDGGDSLPVSELLGLTEAERKKKLLDAVLSEAGRFAQSNTLEINGVKDNQTCSFGESGMMIYQSDAIPAQLNIRFLVIESDEDVRRFATDAEAVLNSDAFKGLTAAVETALAVTNPVVAGAIALGGVLTKLLKDKLKTNKDDLVGYWQASLNREEHYPHGTRDRQDVTDTTGNILIDYTLFGFENTTKS
jgi:hypothetical protein